MQFAMIGWQEWLIILIIVIIVFGAAKLPALGDALGRSIRNFKSSVSGQDPNAKPPAKPEDQPGGNSTQKPPA